jgi:predicted TIM-barrel fold metal-dependent hydrolase
LGLWHTAGCTFLLGLALVAPATPSHSQQPPNFHFENLQALSRLPWFSALPNGRVTVKDPSVGPIVDFHTHLALAFINPLQVDLFHATPKTETYLPTCCAFDLNPYANRNFTPAQRSTLEHDLTVNSLGPGGMRATHTAPNLVAEMDELGIVRSVLLPIDLPFGSDNAGAFLAVAKREPRLVAFGSVHPHTWGASARLAAQAAAGARGLKFHPAIQLTRPDDPRAEVLYKACGERGLLVFWHCGPVGIQNPLSDELTQVAHYERPIAENPHVTFILGHAGALQADRAIQLANRYRNVYLELSSQGLPMIRRLVTEAPPDRLLFGSDWPFYPEAVPLAKILIATEGRPWLRHQVLYANAARLLGLPEVLTP